MEREDCRVQRDVFRRTQDETSNFLVACLEEVKDQIITVVNDENSEGEEEARGGAKGDVRVIRGNLEELSVEQRERALGYLLEKLHHHQAGELLRTSSRPTLCSDDEPSTCICMSIHPEGKSCGQVRSRVECLFSLTLPPGQPAAAAARPGAPRRELPGATPYRRRCVGGERGDGPGPGRVGLHVRGRGHVGRGLHVSTSQRNLSRFYH